VQLYNQLIAAGYAHGDLQRIRAAYELATELFSALYRADGRPFVAHLVGVASVLAAEGAPPAVVTAGLLHSAYTQGDFGHPGRRPSARARQRLRSVVGEQVESLVARYARFPWNDASRDDIRSRPDVAATGPERDVILMRLANTLDDYRELAVTYSAKSAGPAAGLRDAIDPSIDIARGLGAIRLADSLVAAKSEATRIACPSVLNTRRSSSYRVVPPSLRLTARALASRLLGRVARGTHSREGADD
jgi:(p)ppGpp synthase/HD superfamily hydrolase